MSVISREAAIEAMECINDSICAQQAIDALCELPTAERVGKWIDEGTNYSCSECLRGCWVNSDYCPWCGARMVRGR